MKGQLKGGSWSRSSCRRVGLGRELGLIGHFPIERSDVGVPYVRCGACIWPTISFKRLQLGLESIHGTARVLATVQNRVLVLIEALRVMTTIRRVLLPRA